eukprot:scaffold20196_cov69-Phaeocystis_antarctica.AAC.2
MLPLDEIFILAFAVYTPRDSRSIRVARLSASTSSIMRKQALFPATRISASSACAAWCGEGRSFAGWELSCVPPGERGGKGLNASCRGLHSLGRGSIGT